MHESNPIVRENLKHGSTSWDSRELTEALKRDEVTTATSDSTLADSGGGNATALATPSSTIAGYASKTSINHGESIEFYISTTRPSYKIEVYRIGWYGGTGSTLMKAVSGFIGNNQVVPSPDATTGLLECNWNSSYILVTGVDWTSGVYLAKLITDDGKTGYIPFVVRSDEVAADIVYQVPSANYQAYNNWGGKSLYNNSSTLGKRAYKVSFDRPYANASGAGDFFKGDYNLIRFLESNGYNVTYISSIELHANPSLLNNRKIFLSNFHDEYWSGPMRSNLKAALDRGMHMVFLDANNLYWQIRLENTTTTGEINRVLVCYKDRGLDPLYSTNPSLTTIRWRDAPLNQPENAWLGIMYDEGSWFTYGTSFSWVVKNASHWIYEGTNLQDDQQITGLVGYEYDHVVNNGQTPSNLTILSESPTVNHKNAAGIANSSIYTAQGGAIVFSAGTNYWSWKVDDNSKLSKGVDARVQKMTLNLLNRMIGESAPTFNSPDQLQALAVSSSKIQLTWHDNSTSETAFTIERSSDGAIFTLIATVAADGTSYVNSGRTASTQYYYRVRAYNGTAYTAYSNVATSRTLSLMGAPGNLNAVKTASDKITLTWTDHSTDETGFKIQRSTDGVNFADIKTIAANVTTYTNTASAGTYYYRVRAYRLISGFYDFSGYSNIASASL